MEVLSDVLAALALDAELYFRATFHGAFAVSVPAEPARIRFHMVAGGRCWIGLADGACASIDAQAGDLVLVPHGAAHVIADAADTEPEPLDAVLASATALSPTELSFGAAGSVSRLVCGHFSYRAESPHPLLRTLPPLLHVRAAEGRRYDWVESLLRHLDDEARHGRAGSPGVVRRMSEILLIEVLRAMLDRGASIGLLSALADPTLRRALEAIHATPAHPWTLASLAAASGASRSVLASRFRERLGTSPMRYLTRWRIEKAHALLCRHDLSIGEIAGAVGYASEAAFNRAFKDVHGAPPGRLRASLAAARNGPAPEAG